MSDASADQRAACRSIGTKQCAAICLSHSCHIPLGECPEVARVWTDEAITREHKRRSTDPLMLLAAVARAIRTATERQQAAA